MQDNIELLKEIKKGQTGTGFLIEQTGLISLDNSSLIKEDIPSSIETTNLKEWFIPYPFIVTAVFQKFGIENANGRIYPEHVLKKQVELYKLNRINQRMAFSENNHPADVVIDVNNLSTNIIELEWKGNTLIGKMEILLSPGYVKYGIVSTRGDLLANYLYFNKIKLGVSSRGVGSVENKYGKLIVQDDFELVCFDVVTDPSTKNAYISDSYEELTPYLESNSTLNNKELVLEKLNKLIHKEIIL